MTAKQGGAAPVLSVVVPTWNEVPELEGLAASLQRQDLELEWIVADGASDDGTPDFAARLGAHVVGARRGRGAQLAAGARAARAPLLVFLHADTRPAAGALAHLAAAFDDPALVAAGMNQRVDHPAFFYRCVERAANRRVRRGRVYGDSGLCVRRVAYDAVGGFREIDLFEDLDLSARLRRHGRVALVQAAQLVVSARRWERQGRLARTLANRLLIGLWKAGVDPGRLARFYQPHGSKLVSSRKTEGSS